MAILMKMKLQSIVYFSPINIFVPNFICDFTTRNVNNL